MSNIMVALGAFACTQSVLKMFKITVVLRLMMHVLCSIRTRIYGV